MFSKPNFKVEAEKRQPVIVDHLAFTFPIRDLRHLATHPDFRKRYRFDIPQHPEKIPMMPLDIYNTLVERYEAEVVNHLEVLFENFIYWEFGMTLSAPRGRGLHGYTESFCLFDKTGNHELGLVGYGGNNDTIFIQLSGLGCKYLFDHKSYLHIHKVLSSALGVTTLSRLDLAVDDYTGNFDIGYASIAYFDGAFRTSSRGNYPKMRPFVEYDGNGNENITAISVGSRTSKVYWRIYDKAQEQNIKDRSVIWYRNEVELKKISIDALMSPAAFFAGLCDFSASIEPTDGIRFKTIKKKACLELKAKTAWARQQVGKTLSELVDFYDGDLMQVFGLLIPSKHRGRTIDLPETNKHLSQALLGVKECPF
ncbi:replication initiation factor domain-containing protein [Vibrio hannami]|uniref:replication initiation factor domain-containing protein n=1 Tax=Vibrio hannami TaxID=2717094 RepID=UPI00240EAC0B|nr:replication initiation factor domain-containing protein [Vibrio hannami]MDG3085466.1 replication initiation factor domain-containing protein [Vibrio hannami]